MNVHSGDEAALPKRKGRTDYQDAAMLRAAMRRLGHRTEQITRRHSLTAKRYELLLFIQAADDAGAPATVTSLQEQLQTTQGSVTQLVAAAERSGLLRRSPDRDDARSRHVFVTAAAKANLEQAHQELGPERERLTSVLTCLRA